MLLYCEKLSPLGKKCVTLVTELAERLRTGRSQFSGKESTKNLNSLVASDRIAAMGDIIV